MVSGILLNDLIPL